MASSCKLPSSPTTAQASREDSVTATEFKHSPSPSNMLKIQDLLNPAASTTGHTCGTTSSESSPSTPMSIKAAPASDTPRQDTPSTQSSTKRQKYAKSTPATVGETPQGQVNYPPYELNDEAPTLSPSERKELRLRHKLFQVHAAKHDKKDALISDATRFIPYSSDKRSFYGKTGQDGFQVFEYSFCVPGDESNSQYTVIWDYVNGLTRITPFFKACKYTKTTPAKALSTNKGLKELAHSITGGALAAQGYWVPYACARALCLTFAYKIRWALTPIFGPSFVRECLPPNDRNFGGFRIDTEAIRCAEREAEGWRTSPAGNNRTDEIPRSVPQGDALVGTKDLRPRAAKPIFKLGSPFDSDVDDRLESNYASQTSSTVNSPGLSPKTPASYATASPGWTSINHGRATAPPAKSTTTISPLTSSLLTQPRYASWRPADPTQVDTNPLMAVKMPTETEDRHRRSKRRRSSAKSPDPDAEYHDGHSGSHASSSSSSESDDVDIIISREPPKKRVRYQTRDESDADANAVTRSAAAPTSRTNGRSKKFTTEDYRAAIRLIHLSRQDAGVATNGAIQLSGKGKRKSSKS